MAPRFLTVELVLLFHDEQRAQFGGAAGLRDARLLDSAVAQAMATFDDRYLHEDLQAMAAAYLYHIVQNHPFVDGNKRTGLLACLAFLELNGVATRFVDELYDVTMAVAAGRLTKDAVATRLRILFPMPGHEQ
jgi:death-on-curing protein